ncbi:ABC transporter related protein [Xylanimonas cellulosilytica DSM 15894]|uniref:ABC transporter related protein n=1 Tax=Xylanimonas cellulosilytica (strain DSM 15894 / JCM 12276 / CECT 5975 / KCTC 9989 / LMG 20990 / NBRC 107835 / XIL07) TaxID=446471 RepID=D1BY54_XYLCX|nr:ATP-binding cassette domain-containing protein [Xylanimonas cellulosilytica]ACZ29897.1 ABC transporter related protein [Xylanimonas cellulosilytica DSM 15894]
MTLVVADVEIAFGAVTLFAGLSFRVDRGESVAVVGPSGSGKSSLLACISGLLTPAAGQILVNGVDVTACDDDDRARLRSEVLAQVFQEPHLLDELDVLGNIEVPLRFNGVPADEARSRAQRALDDVGVAHLTQRAPERLSGGEAQRVAVARALARGRGVVLADEPTASLDRATAGAVADVLLGAAARSDVALLVSTHDMSVAGRCDRVVDLTRFQATA